jgi:hypothetical protein
LRKKKKNLKKTGNRTFFYIAIARVRVSIATYSSGSD